MRHYAAWVLLLAACSTSVASPPATGEPTSTVPTTVPTTEGADLSPAAAPTPGPRAEPVVVDRVTFVREAEQACASEPEEDTTLGMKQNQAERLRCHETRVADAVARTGAGEGSFQPRWAEATKVCCRLTEESAWVDPKAGTRDWGSMMGFAELSCKIERQIDRAFFLRAKQEGDVASVLAHFRSVKPERHRRRQALLNDWREALAGLDKPATNVSRGELTATEIAQLQADVAYLSDGTVRLAGALCGDWAALREAAGGRDECVALASQHLTRCLEPSPYAGE